MSSVVAGVDTSPRMDVAAEIGSSAAPRDACLLAFVQLLARVTSCRSAVDKRELDVLFFKLSSPRIRGYFP